MKRIFFLLELLAFCILLFGFPKIALANDCDQVTNITVNPTSGDTTTPFTFSGHINNCAGFGGATFVLYAENPNDPLKNPFSYQITTDASGNFNVTGGIFTDTGAWKIEVRYQGNSVPIATGNPVINVSLSFLLCGDTCAPNDLRCPASCPATVDSTTGKWMCGSKPPPPPPPPPPPASSGSNPCGSTASCQTAIGTINTTPEGFVKKVFSVLLSISGGIALLLIIVSGYTYLMSQGNPEKVQGAKETLTSAIVGLLFILFSLVVLQIIGFDILHIPGFCPNSGPC